MSNTRELGEDFPSSSCSESCNYKAFFDHFFSYYFQMLNQVKGINESNGDNKSKNREIKRLYLTVNDTIVHCTKKYGILQRLSLSVKDLLEYSKLEASELFPPPNIPESEDEDDCENERQNTAVITNTNHKNIERTSSSTRYTTISNVQNSLQSGLQVSTNVDSDNNSYDEMNISDIQINSDKNSNTPDKTQIEDNLTSAVGTMNPCNNAFFGNHDYAQQISSDDDCIITVKPSMRPAKVPVVCTKNYFSKQTNASNNTVNSSSVPTLRPEIIVHTFPTLTRSVRNKRPTVKLIQTMSTTPLRNNPRQTNRRQADRKSKLKCPKCRKTFSRESNRKRHLNLQHREDKDFLHMCTRCTFKTNRYDTFYRHKYRRKNPCTPVGSLIRQQKIVDHSK